MSKENRLPRADIPPNYACPYPACGFKPPAESKRPELTYRNHMAMTHGVYYEKAPPSAVAQKLALAKANRYADDLQAIEQLKPWHCVALARHVVYGQPYSEVAKEMKHSAASVQAVAKSPAGKEFIARATQELSDPVKLVKDLMKSDVFAKQMDWMQAWEWAMQAKDYEAVHRMAKDIGLQPALDDAQKAGPTKIILNMNMNDLGSPQVKTSFSIVEEPEYTVEDDDTAG